MLARLGNVWYFGVTSAIAIVPVLALTLIAVQRRSGQRRLQLWSVFGGLVAAGILALLGFGVAAAAARPNLTRGTDEAKQALDSLKAGDFDHRSARLSTSPQRCSAAPATTWRRRGPSRRA